MSSFCALLRAKNYRNWTSFNKVVQKTKVAFLRHSVYAIITVKLRELLTEQSLSDFEQSVEVAIHCQV